MGRPKKENSKTNAERQAEYRAKHKYGSEKVVLNTYINKTEWANLDFICFYYSVTKKKALEILISEEVKKIYSNAGDNVVELNERYSEYVKGKK